MNELLVVDLGTLPYGPALDVQRDVARRRISGEIDEDVLLLVEHPPVVTLGRSAKAANLIASREFLAAQGVELFEVERGGDITFHGPGQLVGYPIIDLKRHRKDLHWYLRQVEESLIRALAEFQIEAGRVAQYTGVWVSGIGNRESGIEVSRASSDSHLPSFGGHSPLPASRKIASIGVHARDWVTWHGFALNVNTDLRYFDLIVPCGITGVTMTSVAQELHAGSVVMRDVADAVVRGFGEVFELVTRSVSREAIGADSSGHVAHTAT